MNLDQWRQRRAPNRARVDHIKEKMRDEIEANKVVDMVVNCAIAMDHSGDPALELPTPEPLLEDVIIQGAVLALQLYQKKRDGGTSVATLDDYRISALGWLREALKRLSHPDDMPVRDEVQELVEAWTKKRGEETAGL